MKRLSLLVLLSIIFVSCSNLYEDEKISHVEQKKYPTLTASFADNETRTFIDSNLRMCWHSGDVVSAFVGSTKNNMYTFCGETGDTSGELIYTENSSAEEGVDLDKIYAVYPFDNQTSISEHEVISCLIGEEQFYVENSFGKQANLMVAVTKDAEDTSLSFKNVCGYLKLKLYGDATISKIELWGNNGENIAGEATVVAKYGEAPQITMGNTYKNKISLHCSWPGLTLSSDVDNPTEFWFVVPPTIFEKGITVVVTDSNGGKFVKKTDKNVTIKRNEIQPMAKLNFNENFKSIIELEREVLITFYNALDGDNWVNNENWCSDRPVNEWYGVRTENGLVTLLHFPFTNNMNGTIPEDIKSLDYLYSIYICDDGLKGELPEELFLGRSLKYVNITSKNADVVLPTQLLPNIVNLQLTCNSVALPESMENLPNLQSMGICAKIGEIPESIGVCKSLQYLSITHSDITYIPQSFSQLVQLKQLDLSRNCLVGEFPNELLSLKNLELFCINNNKLSGKIPEEVALMMDNLERLGNVPPKFFDLSNNMFSGAIPSRIYKHPNWTYVWYQFYEGNLFDFSNVEIPCPDIVGEDIYGNIFDLEQLQKDKQYILLYQYSINWWLSEFLFPNIYSIKYIYEKYSTKLNVVFWVEENSTNEGIVALINELGVNGWILCRPEMLEIQGARTISINGSSCYPSNIYPYFCLVDQNDNIIYSSKDVKNYSYDDMYASFDTILGD